MDQRAHRRRAVGKSPMTDFDRLAPSTPTCCGSVNIQHVPYKGAGPALQDLVGGQIDMMFDELGSSAGHVKSGRVRPLAVATGSRAATPS